MTANRLGEGSGKLFLTELVQRAESEVSRCRETGQWPGYPQTVQSLELPTWAAKIVSDGRRGKALLRCCASRRPTQGPVRGDAGGKRKPKPVCSGSFPCKKFSIRSVKLSPSASGGRFSSSGGGTGH